MHKGNKMSNLGILLMVMSIFFLIGATILYKKTPKISK